MSYLFDVETLSKRSSAVILSFACIHFDVDETYTYEELLESAFFVKFDAQDQIKRLNRSVNKSTIDWWAKQCEVVRKKSFVPSKTDINFEDGYDLFRQWVHSKKDPKGIVWARGNLDQLVMDDMEEQLGIEPVFPYSRWRDVRTAIDFLTDSGNGYCKVPGFDPQAKVYKHDPVHDCAYDVMMLLYGNNE
jgi:hypothetical protein